MTIDRRNFLQAGGGLLIGFVLPLKAQLPVEQEPPYPGLFGPFPAMAMPTPEGKPNAYIQIRADETVTFMITRAEMGQGVLTACSQLLAEELDCDWTKVRPQFAPVDTPLYGYQGTVGSLSIRTTWAPLRRAGAAAREMLLAAAAQKWGVEASQCRADNGFVINEGNQSHFSYGSLAEAASRAFLS
jgi:isoquinoline 1-oxidoreductase beta subunit